MIKCFMFLSTGQYQVSESIQALNDLSPAYEDNYHSLEDIPQSYYGDQSPTDFYPIMPEQKYRAPPMAKNMCRGRIVWWLYQRKAHESF